MRPAVHTFLLFAALSLLFLNSSYANVIPLKNYGKTIRPCADVPVRMASETVNIDIDNNVAMIKCRFELVNEGPATTIEVGFPRGMSEDELLYIYAVSEGKALPVTEKKLDPAYTDDNGMLIPYWTTFPLPLPASNEPVSVLVDYTALLTAEDGGYLSDMKFTYILKTGAYWKGTIGDSTINLRFRNTNPGQIVSMRPGGFVQSFKGITWHMADFEPDENIEIVIMQDTAYERRTEAARLLEQDPDNARAHFLLGTIQYGQERGYISAEAQKYFERAVALDPECWDARWFLAFMYDGITEKCAQLEAIVRGNPDYRCTDETMTWRLESYPGTDNPGVWLDMLKDRNIAFVGNLEAALPVTLVGSHTIRYQLRSRFSLPDGGRLLRPVEIQVPVTLELTGHAVFPNGATSMTLNTPPDGRVAAEILARVDGAEVLTVTVPEKTDYDGKRSGRQKQTFNFTVDAPDR